MLANPLLLVPIVVSFFVTLFFLPAWIKKAHSFGLVGKDMNKFHESKVAEAGGLTVITGFVLGVLVYIALKTFYFNSQANVIEILSLLCCILIVSIIGLVDGLLGWKVGLGRRLRVFLVFFAAIPLMVINTGDPHISFITAINLGILYPLIIIPLGIIGASTTFNFLAGYNGLEARQGILILLALTVAAYITGGSWLGILLMCMVFSLLAFLLYNNYPAKVFPGDVLTYSVGALIGAAAILGNLEWFAVIIFIPNIIEVLLKLRGKLKKESFAMPQADGSIELRYEKLYGLEHVAIKVLKKFKKKVYEWEVVWFINFLELIFIALAFILLKYRML